MSLKIIDHAPTIQNFREVLTDAAVSSTFLGIEFDIAEGKEHPSVVLLDERVISAGDGMITRDFIKPFWVIFFQVGGGSSSLSIGNVAVGQIHEIKTDLEKLFDLPSLTVYTQRAIFSEVDTSEPIAVHQSKITIPTSFLEIYAFRGDNFEGTWIHTPGYGQDSSGFNPHIQTYLDLSKDDRDKTL